MDPYGEGTSQPRKAKYVMFDAKETKYSAGINRLVYLKAPTYEYCDFLFGARPDGTVKGWALMEDTLILAGQLQAHRGSIHDAIVIGADAAATCGADNMIKTWSKLPNGVCTRMFGHPGATCLAGTKTNMIASGGPNGEVFLWDVEGTLLFPVRKFADEKWEHEGHYFDCRPL